MKHLIFLPALLLLFIAGCTRSNRTPSPFHEEASVLYDSALKPFYHGVASGDPLADRVILWTRVTPEDSVSEISVSWEIAEDPKFISIYKSDSTKALPLHDFTVKIDVDALRPDRVYYYRFKSGGRTSITGRTKTAAIGAKDSLKFAIATCANWEWGYFNAYSNIGEREILDGVIHLGDYIYEYGPGKYGDTTIGRVNMPRHELLTLKDYRTRYSQYRLDAGLRRVHQQQPFIAVWDDHEIANNSYTEGAQNHQSGEGDYLTRKTAAKQAYYEWLPIRENDKLYRAFSYGKLVDIFMLDERLEGRTRPVDSIQDPSYENDNRTMLGRSQLDWLKHELLASRATWKVIGNQVLFSDLDMSSVNPKMPRNLDSWEGYPAEKRKIEDFILDQKIQNVIFVTGDTHASWAIESPATSARNSVPFAIELGTTSISSANGDEYEPAEKVKLTEASVMKSNLHVKYYNDRDHGYLLLSLSPQRAKAEWYYVKSLRRPDVSEVLGKKFEFSKGQLKLQ